MYATAHTGPGYSATVCVDKRVCESNARGSRARPKKRRQAIRTRIKPAQSLPKLATGIQGFEQLSRGGLPRQRTTLLIGGPEDPAPLTNRESIANSLLAGLPPTEHRRLLVGLEPVTLRLANVLYEPGETIRNVYFPIDCVVSLLTVDDGRALGAALVGHEGMVGISVVLGVGISSVRARVQTTGLAMRIETARFRDAFLQCPSLQRELYHYTHTKLVLARQNGACNSFHPAEARLARWFLLTSDRVTSQQFFLTQAILAETLGVRRVTITEAAGHLQRLNLISYSRGKISILDRRGLEAAACQCYWKERS